jgi:polyphosphate kinase
MTRNLDRRVEVVFPVEDASCVRHLRDAVLATYLADNVKARDLHADGHYAPRQPAPGEAVVSSQMALVRRGTP